MLLAEALAARKDSIKEIEDLRDRLAAAVVRYEDEDSPADDPEVVANDLTRSLDRFQSLTGRQAASVSAWPGRSWARWPRTVDRSLDA